MGWVVVFVHLSLLIIQVVRPQYRRGGVGVAGFSFIERESDENRVRGMSVGVMSEKQEGADHRLL
jgi:hypothetical protein